MRLGPVEQQEATLERERRTKRELARRSDVGEASAWETSLPGGDIEPFRVHRNRLDAGARAEQGGPCAGVSGLLDPRLIPRVEQQTGTEIECGLRARHHDNPFRTTPDAPRRRDIGRDRSPQPAVSRGVAVPEPSALRRACMPGEDARPSAMRKGLKVGQSRLECALERTWRTSADTDHRPPRRAESDDEEACPGRAPGSRVESGFLDILRAGRNRSLRLDVGDPGAVSDAGDQEAFGRELLEDRDHRVARDAEFRSSGSGRGKPNARLEAAVEDRRTQSFVDLVVERRPRPSIRTDAERKQMEVSHVGGQRFGNSRPPAQTPLHAVNRRSVPLHGDTMARVRRTS